VRSATRRLNNAQEGRRSLQSLLRRIGGRCGSIIWPSTIPAMMQPATQKVRKRSDRPITGFAGAKALAVVTVSLMLERIFPCLVSKSPLEIRARDRLAVGADNFLAVLFQEGVALRHLQDLEDRLGWSAEFDTQRRHDDRTVDQNGCAIIESIS
jgi:hypothetical protein